MTAVATDVDVLQELDFHPALACEHRRHDGRHVEHDAAAWVVWFLCPRCPERRQYLLCESGRRRMQPPAAIGCTSPTCGAVGSWSDFFILCEPLEAAA